MPDRATNVFMGREYTPRNDMVLLQLTKVEKHGGVMLPDISQDSHRWTVIAVGSKVEGLKPGDQVEVIGTVSSDDQVLGSIVRVPRLDKVFITRQDNVLLVIKDRWASPPAPETEADPPPGYDEIVEAV